MLEYVDFNCDQPPSSKSHFPGCDSMVMFDPLTGRKNDLILGRSFPTYKVLYCPLCGLPINDTSKVFDKTRHMCHCGVILESYCINYTTSFITNFILRDGD